MAIILPFVSRQWGYSSYGYVVFPILFTSFFHVVLTHAGESFMVAKLVNTKTLDGFTLSVKELSSSKIDDNKDFDAHYIAIGK